MRQEEYDVICQQMAELELKNIDMRGELEEKVIVAIESRNVYFTLFTPLYFKQEILIEKLEAMKVCNNGCRLVAVFLNCCLSFVLFLNGYIVTKKVCCDPLNCLVNKKVMK